LSTVPLPPNYYDEPDLPPRRRRNWKRIFGWIAGSLVALVLTLAIVAVALLHNNSFRQYLLRIAHTKLSEAVGVQLKMRDFSVHLSGVTPAVDMYDVVIDGAEPYTTPPLLKVDHLSVGIQIVSLLQRKWYLRDIVIDRPVARVYVDANGNSNIPMLKSSDQTTSVFDLGIRHVQLGQGEVYYNDQKSALDADVHNFEFQSSFDTGPNQYSGGLSYKDGKIHFQNLNPMIHNLEAEFEATPDTFRLKRSLLTSGASQFSLEATLDNYAHPKIVSNYQASLDTGELRQILKDATVPVGVVKIAGTANFESVPSKPVIETLVVDGNMSSSGLQIHTSTIHTLVRDISARFAVKSGNAEVTDLRMALLGGRMNGSFKMRDITGAQVSELHATLQNVALGSLQALASAKSMKDYRLTGTTNAKVDAAWRKTFDTLVAHTDATAQGELYDRSHGRIQGQQTGVPLRADLHASYSATADTISFAQSHIESGQTAVDLNGTVSRSASLQVQVRSNDLSEVESLAKAFGAPPEPLGLGGMATFTGSVRGSTSSPQIAGQLSTTSLKVKGTDWQSVRTNIEASPSHVALKNGDATPANNRGRIAFNVDVGLDQWAFRDTSPFQLDVNGSQLNVADLKNLAGISAPVSGTLNTNISLRGTQLNPVGRGSITLTQATVADEPIQSANVDFEGTGDEIRTRFGLRTNAGSAQGNLTYFPKRKAYDGQLQSTGIRLDQLRTIRAKNLNLAGTLRIDAKGSGTFDNPGLQFTAQIPQLQIENQRINGITLQANVANQLATVSLDSQSQTLNTFVRGRGQVKLTGDYQADVVLDTSIISLQPLLAMYMPTPSTDFTGETEVHARLQGPLQDKTRLDAHITIPKLSFAYKNDVQFAAQQPIQLDYTRGVLTLQKTAIKGTGTDLQLQGTVPVTGNAPVSIVALGTIDLAVVGMLDPDITSSGQIQFNVDGRGRGLNPDIQGQVKIVNASFGGDSLPVGLQNGNGVLTLTNNRLEVDKFEGKISGGTLTAKGGLTYRPTMSFNLAVAANGIRTLYPQGVREGVDMNLTLVGTPQNSTLRGQVRLTELSFSPAFDLNDVISGIGGTTGSTAPPGSMARNLNLDISVISTDELNLASSKLSLQGATSLRIRGTAAEPAVIGRVNITGGELFFRGNRYFLDPSTLDFVDPYRVEPRINATVRTKVQDYDIRMLFRGTTDQLRTTYTSEPPLPSSEIINLLVFGKTTAAQAAEPTTGAFGAESMIASGVAGKVSSGIEKIAGISQLSIDPVLGNQQDPGARITIQQRVTGNLFVTFATDATSTGKEVIKLEYQATPRVGVSGVRDQNGGFAVDVRIKRTW
jgi:translocation and assembly module TamB